MNTLRIPNNLIFFLLAVLIACNNTKSDKETQDTEQENRRESSEEEMVDHNFPVVEFTEALFSENVREKRGDGASLIFKFTLQNKTDNKITSFDMRYYAKAIFKDGSYEYYPNSAFFKADDNDYARFDDATYALDASLSSDDVWKPGTTRDFTFVIFEGYGVGRQEFNIDKETFERTPSKFFVAYRYKAISINEEYEKIMAYNFLPQWKEYQKKLGLR
ncbi:MAG: hypothetical protein K9I68_07995 [Bacteroidales bacterium]|nr:hypothetical protein [Bacteroidales bacterium]MCF8338391.1 hypothetical protein [Bacteroidales bacterium]